MKNGFELEGTVRNDCVTTDGQLVDLDYYGRVFSVFSCSWKLVNYKHGQEAREGLV
jgi:hypothetical protein